MAQEVKFTVTLEAALAARLRAAASERGWTAESLAAACIVQHLEVAIRHRVLIERLEQVDGRHPRHGPGRRRTRRAIGRHRPVQGLPSPQG